MQRFILHHFDASPFSEKIRLILGYKQIAWQSVHVPRIMPKPELMPLTGGYRRTPVLQIGRDVYCDTRLIARVLDHFVPDPPLIPRAVAAGVRALEHLADTQLFLAAIPVLFRPAGRRALEDTLGADYLERFRQDRARLFSGGNVARPDAGFSRALWGPAMADLDSQLAASSYLLGDAPTLADFAVYNPVWYVRGNAGVADTLDAYPNLLAWFERMRGLGHGSAQALTPQAALASAAASDVWQPAIDRPDESPGPKLGAKVAVKARDYGVEQVAGQLIRVGVDSMTVEREADAPGRVRVHFPRIGFDLVAADC